MQGLPRKGYLTGVRLLQAPPGRRAPMRPEEDLSCGAVVQAHEPPMSLLSDPVTGTRQDWQEIGNRPDRRVRVEAPTSPAESPLRLARRHRNWTLERVVSEIDSHLGGSGVTASLLSAWERGTRRTSPRYRAALCAMRLLTLALVLTPPRLVGTALAPDRPRTWTGDGLGVCLLPQQPCCERRNQRCDEP